MEQKCVCCGKIFISRITANRYCSNADCQRYRKNQWQKRKVATDAAYKGNKADAQRRWQQSHPGFWRRYRKNHPLYVENNRVQQRLRNQRRGCPTVDSSLQPQPLIAKMDATPPLKSGTYRLVPLFPTLIAKMDTVVVELSVISGA